jgi:hypothetical protein
VALLFQLISFHFLMRALSRQGRGAFVLARGLTNTTTTTTTTKHPHSLVPVATTEHASLLNPHSAALLASTSVQFKRTRAFSVQSQQYDASTLYESSLSKRAHPTDDSHRSVTGLEEPKSGQEPGPLDGFRVLDLTRVLGMYPDLSFLSLSLSFFTSPTLLATCVLRKIDALRTDKGSSCSFPCHSWTILHTATRRPGVKKK